MNKIGYLLAIAAISSIVVNVFLGYSYLNFNNQKTELLEELDSSKNALEIKDNKIISLQTECDVLKTERDQLIETNDQKINQISDLETLRDDLINERDQLKQEVSTLINQRDEARAIAHSVECRYFVLDWTTNYESDTITYSGVLVNTGIVRIEKIIVNIKAYDGTGNLIIDVNQEKNGVASGYYSPFVNGELDTQGYPVFRYDVEVSVVPAEYLFD